MVAPASNQIAAEFDITSEAVVAITITVFLLAQGKVMPTSQSFGKY